MKAAIVAALTACLLAPGSSALHLVERSQPAAIGFDIQRKTVADPVARARLRRRDPLAITLDNEQTLYFANVTLGTPAQELRLHIDTGSSDLWVNVASSTYCKQKAGPCREAGTYNANDSSSYSYISSDFNISYVDGSGAFGDYAQETLHLGATAIPGIQIGIGYKSSSNEGILGIGYTSNEVQVNRNKRQPYPNLPQLLTDRGAIKSNAYSLWLNDLEASTGQILFGGVNTEKYHGSLATMPIQLRKGATTPTEFIVVLTDVTFKNGSQETSWVSGGALPVLLDSGSSLTYLPNAVAQKIFTQFGATYSSSSQAAFLRCSSRNSDATIDFQFSGMSISVPLNEMILDPGVSSTGSKPTFRDGSPACLLGISMAGGQSNVLGDTFLRSAYVVYDLANNEISMAQTNFNSTQDTIREISPGPSGVPDASGVSSPVTAAPTATGGYIGAPTASGGVITGASASASASATPTGAASVRNGVSGSLLAGIICACVFATL
ncbi:MAG: hypothetical protein M1829_006495 [Trizodia sp. TS-e1964]|nr:MAG: hypothetical protein M1829_006495 [Trizodia sp. TS-e1964]